MKTRAQEGAELGRQVLKRALDMYDSDNVDRTAVVDVVTDLRHFCTENGIDIDSVLATSLEHQAAEATEVMRRPAEIACPQCGESVAFESAVCGMVVFEGPYIEAVEHTLERSFADVDGAAHCLNCGHIGPHDSFLTENQ